MSWSISTQASAADAEAAMQEAFDQGFEESDDGTKAQFSTAMKTVKDFVSGHDDSDWFQINASGHAVNEDVPGDRPHISIGITPVAKPYGV